MYFAFTVVESNAEEVKYMVDVQKSLLGTEIIGKATISPPTVPPQRRAAKVAATRKSGTPTNFMKSKNMALQQKTSGVLLEETRRLKEA